MLFAGKVAAVLQPARPSGSGRRAVIRLLRSQLGPTRNTKGEIMANPPVLIKDDPATASTVWFVFWRRYPYRDLGNEQETFSPQIAITPTAAGIATIKAAFPDASELKPPWPQFAKDRGRIGHCIGLAES